MPVDDEGGPLTVVGKTSRPQSTDRRHRRAVVASLKRFELRIPLPTACAGTLGIWLAANGKGLEALLVLAIGLLAEVAAAAAVAIHGAGEGLRDGLRQRFRRRASGQEEAERSKG